MKNKNMTTIEFTPSNPEVKFHYEIEGEELVIHNLEVPLNLRGKGLAKATIEEFLKFAWDNREELDCEVISLYPEPQDKHTDPDKLVGFYLNWFDMAEGGIMTWPI